MQKLKRRSIVRYRFNAHYEGPEVEIANIYEIDSELPDDQCPLEPSDHVTDVKVPVDNFVTLSEKI